MNTDATLEKIDMTNGTEGGVLHLLRLTRTQCHAWVAFVALRRADGTIDITAVPGADDESSEWSLETLEGIVRQTLEDPLIGEGRAVIRVSEVFRRYWPGERQYTRMAVAPLNDIAEPGRPWGLLCALDPVDGQFSEDQLDMLGRLAVRFTNHLRVRRQFIEDAAASDALLARAVEQVPATPAPEPAPAAPWDEAPAAGPGQGAEPGDLFEGIVRIERAGAFLARQAEPAQPAELAVQPEVLGERADEALSVQIPGAAWPSAPEAAVAGHEAPEVEVVFGEAYSAGAAPGVPEPAPAVVPAPEAAAAPEVAVAPEPVAPEATVVPEAAVPETAAVPEAVEATGEGAPLRRVRLSELIDQLEETLGRLRASKRRGAFFLVELAGDLSSPVTAEELVGAAEHVLEGTRHHDVVLGVGSDMLAVVMELGPRASDLTAIRDRLSAACAEGFAEGRLGGLRATVLGLDPEAAPSGEGLVLAAIRQLGNP